MVYLNNKYVVISFKLVLQLNNSNIYLNGPKIRLIIIEELYVFSFPLLFLVILAVKCDLDRLCLSDVLCLYAFVIQTTKCESIKLSNVALTNKN